MKNKNREIRFWQIIQSGNWGGRCDGEILAYCLDEETAKDLAWSLYKQHETEIDENDDAAVALFDPDGILLDY